MTSGNESIATALSSLFGGDVSTALMKDDTTKKQLAVLFEIHGEKKSLNALQDGVDKAFEDYVSRQHSYAQDVKDTFRDSWFLTEGLSIISVFLSDGSSLFKLPVDSVSLPCGTREVFDKAWQQFTRTFSANPKEGESLLEREIAAAWLIEKQKLPTYLKPEVVESCRNTWLSSAVTDIIQAVTEMSMREPPICFAQLPREEMDNAQTMWMKFDTGTKDKQS